jgi:hypothetical protein
VFLLIMVPIAQEFNVPLAEVTAVFTITLWMRQCRGWLADRVGRKIPPMISINAVPSPRGPVATGTRWEATKPNARRPRQRSFSNLKVARTNRTLPNCIVFEMFRYTCCIRLAANVLWARRDAGLADPDSIAVEEPCSPIP